MTDIKINAVIERNGQYLLLKRSPEDGSFWQTITGGVEDGENLLDTIRREVEEETGITDLIIEEKPIHYFTWQKNGNDLVEIAYLCHTTQSEVRLSPDHTEFVWADKDKAEVIVEKPNNKVVIRKANQIDKAVEQALRRPDVSVKLILRCKDEAFMLKHHSTGRHDFPGGRMEWGEAPEETLARELKEELNYELPAEPVFIYVWNYVAKDKSRHSVHLYYLLSVTEKPNLRTTEDADVEWLPKGYFFGKDEVLADKMFDDSARAN